MSLTSPTGGRKVPAMKPTPQERMRLAVAADVSLRTVDRCYEGLRVHDTTRRRICSAAQELGYPEPPSGEVKP